MSSDRRLDYGMFHRRLMALTVIFGITVAALGARLWELTVVDGARHLDVAESRLDREKLLPTWRGTIRDRKGRVIAQDVPSYDLAVRFTLLDGSWARERALVSARTDVGRSVWGRLSESERIAAIAARQPAWEAKADALLQQAADLAGVPREELDRRVAEIITRVNRKVEAVHARQIAVRSERYGPESIENFKPEPIREQLEAHLIATGVPDEIAFAARRVADANPKTIEVIDAATRRYPWSVVEVELPREDLPKPLRSYEVQRIRMEGVADHVVGGVRFDVWEDDIKRRPFESRDESGAEVIDFGGYRPGRDQVGVRGIEAACEDLLRGARGEVIRRVDDDEEVRREPVAGSDIQLSLDIALQSRVEAALNPLYGLTVVQPWHLGSVAGVPKQGPLPMGARLAAGVVVLDIVSGEILALASAPTIAQARDMSDADRARLIPYMNRAVGAAYAPGSVVKPLVYAAAVAEGVFAPDGTVSCTGHFFKDRQDVARCWIYRPEYKFATHDLKVGGPLGIEQAIARSCNIFFYTLASKLGAARLASWYRAFGLGAPLDCGISAVTHANDGRLRLAGEASGSLPSAADLQLLEDRHDSFTGVIMGIGQGPVTWSPIQAANAYATIARDGLAVQPSLFRGIRPDGRGSPPTQLGLNPRARSHLLEGMRRAIEESYGTGHHLAIIDGIAEAMIHYDGVEVWAKTGTAQAPGIRVDVDEDGVTDRSIDGADHAWFVGLVGDRATHTQRYAIAVLVEHGGPGGRAAGPIASAVIRALIDEGYLGSRQGSGDDSL